MADSRELEELEKQYDPAGLERPIYDRWMQRGYFHVEPAPGKPHYSITIPPPNVTGELHMGHALCYTIHDVLVRWKRMQGFTALCLPGTDHAGIATQNVVEKMLALQGITRHDLGRDAFIERVWEWKDKYGSTIIEQMKTLGCSFDWERERFTMDAGYSDAVLEAFIHLFNKGWIYRGARVTNWCPRCRTAISDIEVDDEPRPGHLWHFKYPIENGYAFGTEYITIATTRPETMLGDTAVAVHPDDPRFQHLIGQHVILPLIGRRIPIIPDSILVDPEFGTGAVKVTPAHDFSDFEAGERNHLPLITVIGPDGAMTPEAGRFAGMDRMEAREAVIREMDAASLLVQAEDYEVKAPTCDRCKTLLEPLLSEQWFCRMKELAAPAIEAVRSGDVRFVPGRWSRVYLDWMEKLRDWCISRQLWWGHRIPVYYCDQCSKAVAARSAPDRCPECGGTRFTQDPDVLDTWFSSAMWPFATLGWPHKAAELEHFYPTDVLITAPEIIYLWVARMIFNGLEFMGQKPFSDVYIYATVLDARGDRMSKSKGNGVNPLLLLQQYGADATRYAVVTQAGKSQSFRFVQEKQCPHCKEWSLQDSRACDKCGKPFEGAPEWRAPQVAQARLFCNKIWQASRFVLMNLGGSGAAVPSAVGIGSPCSMERLEDRWILSRLADTVQSVNEGLASYDLDVATRVLHEFVWSEFCDWYIEIAKPRLNAGDPTIRANLACILDTILRLLHPFMPFLTEAIWQTIPGHGESIMLSSFPVAIGVIDPPAEELMGQVMDLVVRIRNIRTELKLQPGLRIPVYLAGVSPDLQQTIELIEQRARCQVGLEDTMSEDETQGAGSAVSTSGAVRIRIPLQGLVDVEKERKRIESEIASLEKEIVGLQRQLENEQFLSRAPEAIVNEKRQRLALAHERIQQVSAAHARLGQ